MQVTIPDQNLKQIIKEALKEIVQESEIAQSQGVNLEGIIKGRYLLGIPLFPFAIHDLKTAAMHAGVSVSTLRRAIQNGRLKGGNSRVTARAVLRTSVCDGSRKL